MFTSLFGSRLVKKIIDCVNIYSTQKKGQDDDKEVADEDNLELDMMQTPANNHSNSVSQLFRLNNMQKYRKRKEREEKEDFGNIPEDEIFFIEKILYRFVIPQDTSNNEQVNIKLALK